MKKYLLTTIIMMVALLSANTLQAQIRWKGSDYTTLLSGSGTRVYLYNVGTGRFIIHGGDWGSQARLFYEDTGKTLIIQNGSSNNIFFEPGIETDGTPALGANIPLVTSANQWGNNDETFTVLFDGQERIGYGSASGTYRNMHFVRVDEGDDNVFTYYIYENFGTRRTNYNKENSGSGTASNADYSGVYLGAAYGENWNNQDGDPNGPLVLLSSSFDKATWSTVDPTSTDPWNCGVKNAALEGLPEGTTTVSRKMTDEVPIFNADTKVELRKLYQWRIVTEEQLLASMTNSDVNDGLSTNLTYLIYDRGFERNDWSFFDYWQTAQFTDASYTTSGSGRYRYTWGLLTGNRTDKGTNNQNVTPRSVNNEAWNIPVRLKAQFETKANAKFGFLEFEGIGTAYTYIDAPEAGVYKISCYGFYQGHEGYLFATTTTPSNLSTTSIPTTQKSAFKPVTGLSKNNEANVMAAGNDFVYEKDSYYREVEIHATAGQRIYFGVGKNAATIAQYNSTYYGTYCYDSDWVGADQFQISYLGTDEAKLLDEDETRSFTDYIKGTSDNPFINRTLRLHRTFQTGKWNSFIIPVDMTAVQVRNAFGDDARVAKLDGLGTRSKNAKIIDFVTIPLPAEGAAIEKGKFYLIMPTKEPTPGTGSTSNKPYYTIGAYTFSGPSLDAVKIVEDTIAPASGAANPTEASVMTKGTYKSTPGYEYGNGNKFEVGEEKVEGTYIPAGSYVIGVKGDKTTIFHTQNDLKTKGFRAWLVDVESETTQNTISSVAINGIADITAIDEVLADELKAKPTNGIIYDISGRKVGDISNLNSSTLTKGIYIVNGKKIVIK